MSDSIIIGVDHGYAAMKTAHFAFPSGLVAYEHEPYTLSNVLEYGGKFYVVGSGRQPLQKDKTQAEDYYLLTLAAIAKELEYRNAGTMADVHLATGLPLTSFGRDKKAFRDYLCRDGKPVSFRFEGLDYTITISKVSLYPQGYAAKQRPHRTGSSGADSAVSASRESGAGHRAESIPGGRTGAAGHPVRRQKSCGGDDGGRQHGPLDGVSHLPDWAPDRVTVWDILLR